MDEEDISEYEKAIINEMIDDLEDQGVFEWVGMGEDGDRILAPNLEKMKEIIPEMYDMIMEEMSESLQYLYSLGLVDVEYTEDLEPMFRISEAGREYMREHGFEMGEEL